MLLTKNKTIRKIHGLFETFNPLFLRLLRKNPSKVSAFPGEIFRAYMSLVGKDKWICNDIFDVLPDMNKGCKIVVEHLPDSDKSLPLHELACLALITKAINPKQIFEIGTYTGRTTLNFAQNCPENCIVWTLNSPINEGDNTQQQSHTGIDYKGKDVEHKIKQLYGDNLTFDFSPYFGKIDIVFVNGAHHYKAVKSDTINALQMIKQNGYIIWHDFANYGDLNSVTQAIFETLPSEKVVQIAGTQLALYVK